MTNGNYVAHHVQHAQGPHPATRAAAAVVPSRDGRAGPHHYGKDAIAEMTLVGAVGLFATAAALLLLVRLTRRAFGRKQYHHSGCNCHQHFDQR